MTTTTRSQLRTDTIRQLAVARSALGATLRDGTIQEQRDARFEISRLEDDLAALAPRKR